MALYCLLDWDLLEKYRLPLPLFLKFAKGLHCRWLQYRDKSAPLDLKRERLLQIRRLWPRVLIVNDEVSLLPLADGVHIGQEDLEVLSQKWGVSKGEVIARLRKGGKIVGLSTHNREEILEANRFDLSYIGLGAYRPTSTKKGATPLPLPLSELIPLSHHPVAVIGGVRLYDKIPGKFKVVGSDLCRFISTQLSGKRSFQKR